MYHLIGIKGSGMSALAQILHTLGHQVQGSDIEKKIFTETRLKKLNIKILPFNKENIKEHMIIVYGTTFSNNEEVIEAKNKGLEVYSYPEMLGKLTELFRSICICGTHGKTTVTTILSNILSKMINVSYLIGDATGYGNNLSDYLVMEACEYNRNFLKLDPHNIIITNIDLDHVDYYKDINDMLSAYQEFVNKSSSIVIANGDDENVRKLQIKKPIYYGLKKENNVVAKNILYKKKYTSFEVYINNKFYHKYKLPIFASHMVLNVLAVITYTYYIKLNKKDVKKLMKNLTLPKRRFYEKKVKNNIIIDDYAHHPNEIRAVINSCRQKYPKKNLIAIFEPHTFSRTDMFKNEISKSLNLCDKAYILPIYQSREKQEDYVNINSSILLKYLTKGYLLKKNEIRQFKNKKNTLFLFMSPNDLSEIEKDLENYLLEN